MKFNLVITKDILNEAKECEGESCALALPIKEIVPCHVGESHITYVDKSNCFTLASIPTTEAQQELIERFDRGEREELEGMIIPVFIPDSVIEHHYGDAVKAVQKIADCTCIKAFV